MSLNDRAEVVAVAKLAGLLDVSNEMMSDASINLTAQFTTLLRDSLSRQLDDGLLNGRGPPEPEGVIAPPPCDRRGPAGGGARRARRDQRTRAAPPPPWPRPAPRSPPLTAPATSTGALMFPGGFAAVPA